jgi:hypothetical protein
MDVSTDFYSLPNNASLFKEEKKAKISSKVMWAIYALVHPSSPYHNISEDEAKLIIKADILDDPTFDFDRLDMIELRDKFEKFYLTKSKKLLKNWERKLEERDKFISDLAYNQETYELLDKMMGATSRMWDQYLKIQKMVDSDSEESVYGDSELSLNERGLI